MKSKQLFLLIIIAVAMLPRIEVAKAAYTYSYLTLEITESADDVLLLLEEDELYTTLNQMYVKTSGWHSKVGLQFEGWQLLPDACYIDEIILRVHSSTPTGADYSYGLYNEDYVIVTLPFDQESDLNLDFLDRSIYGYIVERFDADILDGSGWHNITLSYGNFYDGRNWNQDNKTNIVTTSLNQPDYPYYRGFDSYDSGNSPQLIIKYHTTETPSWIYDNYGDADYIDTYNGYDIWNIHNEGYEDFRTYDETDPDGDITISEDGLSVSLIDHVETESSCYLYKTDGGQPFTVGDYYHYSCTFSYSESDAWNYGWLARDLMIIDDDGNDWNRKIKGSDGNSYSHYWFLDDSGYHYTSGYTEGVTYWFRNTYVSTDHEWETKLYTTEERCLTDTSPSETYSNTGYTDFDEQDTMDIRIFADQMSYLYPSYTIDELTISNFYYSPNGGAVDLYFLSDENGTAIEEVFDSIVEAKVYVQSEPSTQPEWSTHFLDYLGIFGVFLFTAAFPISGMFIRERNWTMAIISLFIGTIFGYVLAGTWLSTF